MPEPQASDPIAEILRTVQTSNRVRAAAWDAAYSSDDPDEIATRLKALPIGDSARAKLWDARFGAPVDVETDTASAPKGPPTSILQPMTGREFLDYQSDQRSRISTLAQEHPLITAGGVALAGGAPALARAALGSGASLSGAAQTVAGMAAPIAKYEVTKRGLEMIGLPSSISTPIAIGVSGYRRGARQAPASETAAPDPAASAPTDPVAAGMSRGTSSAAQNAIARGRMVEGMSASSMPAASAAPASPAEAPPVAPAPQPAPAAAEVPRTTPAAPALNHPPIRQLPGETVTRGASERTSGQMSPQWIRNDLGLVNRRWNANLSDAEFAEAESLVVAGRSPAAAVADVTARRPQSAAPPAPSASSPDPTKAPPRSAQLSVTVDEAKVYARLIESGKTHRQAIAAIKKQRALAAQLGTPSPEDVRRTVAERNATGRWPENRMPEKKP